MAKTVNSDIWWLYKGSITFHLITHDTDENKSTCIFLRNNVVIKQYIINNFKTKISWEFIMTCRISTLCRGRYMQECDYVTIGNPAFCLFFYFTGRHFWGEFQHGDDVCGRPIRTREKGGVSLSNVLWDAGNKKPGTPFKWSLVAMYRWSLGIERTLTQKPKGGPQYGR